MADSRCHASPDFFGQIRRVTCFIADVKMCTHMHMIEVVIGIALAPQCLHGRQVQPHSASELLIP